MSGPPALSAELVDRVAALIREAEQVEAARPPMEAEIAGELARLDAIASKTDAAWPSFWQSVNPTFTTAAFNDSVLAALLLIAPDKVRQVVTEHTKRRADAWKGLRLTEADKARRLAKLQTDLKAARARLEVRRREIEQQTTDVLPRVGDDPSVWLLRDQPLAALAGASNGRSK